MRISEALSYYPNSMILWTSGQADNVCSFTEAMVRGTGGTPVHVASRDYAHSHIHDVARTWPYHELIVTCMDEATVRVAIDSHVHRSEKLTVGRQITLFLW